MGILDSLLGKAIDRAVEAREKKRLTENYRGSLRREVRRCMELAKAVIRDEETNVVVQSPAYRLPTAAHSHWFDKQDLLNLDDDGLAAIEGFYELVDQINRGLDQAADSMSTQRYEVLLLEGNRNRLKAQRMPELGARVLELLGDDQTD